MLLVGMLYAQLPKVNKPSVGIKKPTKETGTESGTTGTDNSSTGETGASTPAASPEDEKAQMDLIYYLTDKNGSKYKLLGNWESQYYFDANGCANYLNTAREFNADEVKAKIAEGKKRWPDVFGAETHWVNTELVPFLNEMDSEGGAKLTPKVDEIINNSVRMAGEGQTDQALAELQKADNLAEGLALVSKAQAKPLQDKVAAQRSKLTASLQQYYTSEFHAKNAGKVVFSKSPILIKQENPGAITNSFAAGDKIFAMAYLNGKLSNYDKEDFLVHYSVDGNKMNMLATANLEIGQDAMGNTYLAIPLLCDVSEMQHPFAAQFTRRMAQAYKEGKHVIDIKVSSFGLAMGEKYMATGSFELDCATGNDGLQAKAEAFRKWEVENTRLPAPAVSNPQLEAEFLRLIKGEFTEEVTPLRAVILDGAWQIEYEDQALPQYRYMRGLVAFKVARTGLCHYRGLGILQTYEGGGVYSGTCTVWDPGYGYDIYEMNCANVNK